jgi:ribosome maturation factor RimP
MHIKKLLISGIILVLVMMLGITSCASEDMKTFQGILKQVDGLSGNVTVTMKDGTSVQFNLEDIELNTSDEGASLEPGDGVTIEKDKDGKVRRVRACCGEIQGTVKSIVGDNVTITTAKKGDIILLVTPETVITMAEMNRAALTDLAVGQRVTAKYEIKTSNAIKIIVHLEKREAEVQGTIKSITGDNVTITTAKNGDITLVVTAETTIMTTGSNDTALTGLAVGQRVTARYDIAANQAIKIIVYAEKKVVRYEEIQGTIADISGDNVTIAVEKRGDITVKVTPDTMIIVGENGNAALIDLAAGQSVNAKYETSTMNAVKIIVKIEKTMNDVQGTIQAISSENQTVTIAVDDAETIILNVTPETLIKIVDAGVGEFSDMDVGQKVEAYYYVDTMDAVKVYIYIEDD